MMCLSICVALLVFLGPRAIIGSKEHESQSPAAATCTSVSGRYAAQTSRYDMVTITDDLTELMTDFGHISSNVLYTTKNILSAYIQSKEKCRTFNQPLHNSAQLKSITNTL
jgi:hypothetical protein